MGTAKYIRQWSRGEHRSKTENFSKKSVSTIDGTAYPAPSNKKDEGETNHIGLFIATFQIGLNSSQMKMHKWEGSHLEHPIDINAVYIISRKKVCPKTKTKTKIMIFPAF